MTKRSRRNHSPVFEVQVALLGICGELTVAELAKKFDIHPNLILKLKMQLLEKSVSAFDGASAKTEEVDTEKLHTDQDSQFTSGDFVAFIAEELGVRLSMDGKGALRDNVFVGRFWGTVKHEEVYLRAYESGSKTRASLGRDISRSTKTSGRTRRLTSVGCTKHTTACQPEWRHDREKQLFTHGRSVVQNVQKTRTTVFT